MDKNVIRSKSGNGAITLALNDRAAKDYRRLTLVVSRLNRNDDRVGNVYVSYTDNPNASLSSAKPLFHPNVMLRFFYDGVHDGFNTSRRLAAGKWSEFRINFEGKAGLSMEVERAYLSQQVVLPDSFILPFVVSAIVGVCIVMLLFWTGLISWFLKRDWAILVVIVIAQLLVVSYYAGQKKSLSFDETTNYFHANNDKEEVFNYSSSDGAKWLSQKYLFESMTAQTSEGLAHFNELRTRHAVHSPLYFMQLHTASLFAPSQYSISFAVAVNVLWYIGHCALLYSISKRFLAGKLALLPVFFWGFSAAATSMCIYVRSYSVATFFYTLLFYLAIEMLSTPNSQKNVDTMKEYSRA
ncbi:hypothetical protein AGMMS49941_13310 [Deferribacterales bacterium]|nr:hypothetical protein AGMMS49941_13310 [Deferribacterales bacterium]